MELNRWDDLPYHQTVAPLGQPSNSDPHFNDGYYFAAYAPGFHLFCGLRVHPNNNVLDGYAGLVVGGEQRSERFSRALHPRKDRTDVGPLSVEIVDPMVVQRVVLAESEIGVAFDLTFTAVGPPHVEHGHRQYRFGRLLNDIVRYTQVCRASGSFTLDGVHHAVDRWYACRDHSWGVRSTMGPHVPIQGVEGTAEPDRRAIRLWVPFEVGELSGFFHQHEDADGAVLDFEGRVDRSDGRSVPLATVRHALRYHPGTEQLSGGEFWLVEHDGSEHHLRFDSVCRPAHPQGFGYTRGWRDGGQPGVYRGAEYREHETFDVSDPAVLSGPDHVPVARRLGGTEFACAMTDDRGREGMAHVEHMVYGPYHPTGLKGPRG